MSNQSMLLPSALDGVSVPSIDLDTLNTGELRDLCKGMLSDFSFLAGAVPSRVTSLLSTGLTAGSALTAGAIDGYLGDKANIGPALPTTPMPRPQGDEAETRAPQGIQARRRNAPRAAADLAPGTSREAEPAPW